MPFVWRQKGLKNWLICGTEKFRQGTVQPNLKVPGKILYMKITDHIQRIKTHPDFRDAFVYHRLGFRLPLDHLAKETLNKGKNTDGLQAVA